MQAGLTVLRRLLEEPYLSTDPHHEGILLHSVYHRPNGWDYVPSGKKDPVRRVEHVGGLSSAGGDAAGGENGRGKLLHVLLSPERRSAGKDGDGEGNKVALVTGGARGIGLGIARRLAQDGFAVAVSGRRPAEDARAGLDTIREHGGDAIYVQADVADGAARARLLLEIEERFGRLDVLVNNAGIAPRVRADILEAREEHFDEVMATNLKGPYFLTQAVAGWMVRQRESLGAAHRAIINIGSISATVASVNRGEYCLSKAGVAMATRLWAVRLAEYGIGVYEVRPGIIESEMTAGVHAKYDALIEGGLLVEKRWGKAADVASAVSVLARGELPYATGALIVVDGGLTLARLVDGGESDRATSEDAARGAMGIRGCVGNSGMDSRCILFFYSDFSSGCAGCEVRA